jgi:hypothetical protein
MPAGNSGGGGGGSQDLSAASATTAAGGTADRPAPRTPPMVLPQRSVTVRDARAEDVASGSDDFDDARSWAGGSPESSMSAYYSPR